MNRWFLWVLAPIMLGTAVFMPIWTDPPTFTGHVVLYVFCGALVLGTLGLANPRRFSWALRGVAVVVVGAYLAYAAYEFVQWREGKPFGLGSPAARSNLYNALRGLLVFGIPSLIFLFVGRSRTSVDALLNPSDQVADLPEEDAE